jgi:hypothetical protein
MPVQAPPLMTRFAAVISGDHMTPADRPVSTFTAVRELDSRMIYVLP